MKRRLSPGCWGPLLVILGVVLMFVGYWLGFATAVLRPGGLLETSGKSSAGPGIWGNVLAVGAFLLVAGFLVMLVQGLLWLVHKAMSR